MKLQYTDFDTIGIMTMDEAIELVNKLEESHKQTCGGEQYQKEFTFNIQVVVTTEKGLLIKESGNFNYHFIYLKK